MPLPQRRRRSKLLGGDRGDKGDEEKKHQLSVEDLAAVSNIWSEHVGSTTDTIDNFEQVISFLHAMHIQVYAAMLHFTAEVFAANNERISYGRFVALVEGCKQFHELYLQNNPHMKDDMLDAFIAVGGEEDTTGFVDLHEMQRVMNEFQLTPDIMGIVEEIDKDGNNELDFSEFTDLLQGDEPLEVPSAGKARTAHVDREDTIYPSIADSVDRVGILSAPSHHQMRMRSQQHLGKLRKGIFEAEPSGAALAPTATLVPVFSSSGSGSGDLFGEQPISRAGFGPGSPRSTIPGYRRKPVPRFYRQLTAAVASTPHASVVREKVGKLMRQMDYSGQPKHVPLETRTEIKERNCAINELSDRLHHTKGRGEKKNALDGTAGGGSEGGGKKEMRRRRISLVAPTAPVTLQRIDTPDLLDKRRASRRLLKEKERNRQQEEEDNTPAPPPRYSFTRGDEEDDEDGGHSDEGSASSLGSDESDTSGDGSSSDGAGEGKGYRLPKQFRPPNGGRGPQDSSFDQEDEDFLSSTGRYVLDAYKEASPSAAEGDTSPLVGSKSGQYPLPKAPKAPRHGHKVLQYPTPLGRAFTLSTVPGVVLNPPSKRHQKLSLKAGTGAGAAPESPAEAEPLFAQQFRAKAPTAQDLEANLHPVSVGSGSVGVVIPANTTVPRPPQSARTTRGQQAPAGFAPQTARPRVGVELTRKTKRRLCREDDYGLKRNDFDAKLYASYFGLSAEDDPTVSRTRGGAADEDVEEERDRRNKGVRGRGGHKKPTRQQSPHLQTASVKKLLSTSAAASVPPMSRTAGDGVVDLSKEEEALIRLRIHSIPNTDVRRLLKQSDPTLRFKRSQGAKEKQQNTKQLENKPKFIPPSAPQQGKPSGNSGSGGTSTAINAVD